MLKNMLAVFFGVVLAGFFLFGAYELYIDYKIAKIGEMQVETAANIELEKKSDAESLKKMAADNSVTFCVRAANAYHKLDIKLVGVVQKKPTFAAIDYIFNGNNYHARCVFEYNSNVVESFDTVVI